MRATATVAGLMLLGACARGDTLPPAPAYAPDAAPMAGDPVSMGPGAAYAPPADDPMARDPATRGPAGSSQPAPGEMRFDEVGYASIGSGDGVSALVRGLGAGSFAEVTALTTGRTILVRIDGGDVPPGPLALLSPGAVGALGIDVARPSGVRVRLVNPAPEDRGALLSGRAAPARLDAPAALLTGLRARLPGAPVPAATAGPPPAMPARPPETRPAPRPAVSGGFVVQVAALSTRARADALARDLNGTVVPAGRLFRVQTGPYPDAAAAERGRADAARRGFRDARVVRAN